MIEILKYEFKNSNDKIAEFALPKTLLKRDSIKIEFKNKKAYTLHNFISSHDYGGNKFLGCNVEFCSINEIDSVFIKDKIYLE